MPKPATPSLTVDCAAFGPDNHVLLIRRKYPPFQGAFALPGGFVNIGETVEAACRREFIEETGLEAGALHLVGVYSDPARDPRGHTVSVVYATRIPRTAPQAGDDAAEAHWIADWRQLNLAFDHYAILSDAEKRLKQLQRT